MKCGTLAWGIRQRPEGPKASVYRDSKSYQGKILHTHQQTVCPLECI
jgi:hypothetical protein